MVGRLLTTAQPEGTIKENMNPPTNKDLITGVDHKVDILIQRFDDYKEADKERLENTQKILNDLSDIVKEHDNRIKDNENCLGKKSVKIANLESRVNSWSLLNSLGVVFSAILGYLGIKTQ